MINDYIGDLASLLIFIDFAFKQIQNISREIEINLDNSYQTIKQECSQDSNIIVTKYFYHLGKTHI